MRRQPLSRAGNIAAKLIALAVLLLLLCNTAGHTLNNQEKDQSNLISTFAPPRSVQGQLYENDQIAALIGAPRQYGYRIGDRIPITITVVAAPGILIDHKQLIQINNAPGMSAFEAVTPPVITAGRGKDGQTIITIRLLVRSFDAGAELHFTGSFAYATGVAPDQTIHWKPAPLPNFAISTTNTGTSHSNKIKDGDLQHQSGQATDLVLITQLLGALLLLMSTAYATTMLVNRQRK